MSHRHDTKIPRPVLFGAALMIAFALLVTHWGRSTGTGLVQMPESVQVEALDLRFEDRPDGGLVARGLDGREVLVFSPGAHGFVRGVLRGFARERRLEKIGAEAPFRLTRWADGRISIADPVSGRVVELDAFGPTNVAAFAALFDDERDS